MKCQSCGATVPPEAATCEYCGSHIADAPGRLGRDVFERIRNSTQYAERDSPARAARLPKLSPFHKVFLGVFFTIFCGTALFMFVMAVGMSGIFGQVGGGGFAMIPLCMGVVPLGMFAIGIYVSMSLFRHIGRTENGELLTTAAVVVGKRTHVAGDSDRPSTTYYATFETEDGRREEYQLWDGRMYGRLSDDDGGVLFLRDRYAVDFDRVV